MLPRAYWKQGKQSAWLFELPRKPLAAVGSVGVWDRIPYQYTYDTTPVS